MCGLRVWQWGGLNDNLGMLGDWRSLGKFIFAFFKGNFRGLDFVLERNLRVIKFVWDCAILIVLVYLKKNGRSRKT